MARSSSVAESPRLGNRTSRSPVSAPRLHLRARPGLLVAAVTFLAVGPLRMSTVLVIAIMAVVSGWLHRPSRLDEGIAGVEGRSA